jgi:hypothetical protein
MWAYKKELNLGSQSVSESLSVCAAVAKTMEFVQRIAEE